MILKGSITMLAKLSLALAVVLSAFILAAAQSSNCHELRTGVPYYMAPYIWTLGGGVAPGKVGNEECPSAVTVTPEVSRGVPIIFSSPLSDNGEGSVVIDEYTDVSISFNGSAGCDYTRTWANRLFVPGQKTVPLELIGTFTVLTYEPTRFRIKRESLFYRVYSLKDGEGGVAEYNIVAFDDKGNRLNRLALSKVESSSLFSFNEAEYYYSDDKINGQISTTKTPCV